MNDQQLYFAVGLPIVVAITGILVNVGYFVSINGRINSLESRLDARINSLEIKLDTSIDLLIGKISELDNRLVRLEERLKH
jgi:hypothetical protein